MIVSGRPNDSNGVRRSPRSVGAARCHPDQDIAGVTTRSDDGRIARCLDLDSAEWVAGDDGAHSFDPTTDLVATVDGVARFALARFPLARFPLEAHELAGDPLARDLIRWWLTDSHRPTQVHARPVEDLRRPGGDDATEVVAGHRGMDLGRTGGHDDLLGTNVEDTVWRPCHDRRPGMDRYDFDAVSGIKDDDVSPSRSLRLSRLAAMHSPTDNRDPDVTLLDVDIACWR